MRTKLFTAIISILIVFSLVTSVSSLEGAPASTGSSGGAANSGASVPFQITIIFPENDSIVTEVMLSDVTVSEKENWLVKSGNNQLEINEPIGPSSQGVVDFIDDDDLSVLTDGIFVVNGGKYKYEQFIHFDNPAIKVTYDENNDLFLKITGNEAFARYEINFLTAPKSIITDSQENPDPDGEYLPDFQNAKLTILGKEYTVLHATRPAGNTSIKLEIMAGHKSDVILVGESKTFTFGNNEYVVHLISVDGKNVEFQVNGDLLEIQPDTVYVLSDGTPISANIFWAGSEPVITLFFNAEKMVLQDDNISSFDNIPTHKIMINDETIDGAEVVIRGSILTSQEIDTISINMIAGNDYFVPENGKLSDAIEAAGDQKEVLMNGLLDFEYHGLNEEGLPLVYVTSITEETKKGLPLLVLTEEDVICSYSLGEGYQEMEVTGGTSHLQYLFNLEKGQDYEVSVQCTEEEDINTAQVNFHVADDVTAPQITIISPEDESIVTEYLVSEEVVFSEFWKIENGEDKLEMGESINEVVNSIGSNELSPLSNNVWFVGEVEYGYQQSLSFDSVDPQNEIVTFAEDEDNGKADAYFFIKENQQIAKYIVNFESPVQSEIDAYHSFPDYQETALTLFGKEYVVVNAKRIHEQGVTLTLKDHSFNVLELEDHDITDNVSTYYGDIQKDTLLEGESKAYTVKGKEYEVNLLFTNNNNKAKFTINGETTPLMDEGASITLSDGIVLNLEEVLYQDFAGGVHQAEFSLKAIGPSELEFNYGTVDGAHVIIKGTINDETVSLSSIEVDMIAQDDYYVAPGETLLEQPELENKNLLFAKNWDFRYEGMNPAIETHKISVNDKASGREYWLTFTNNAGQKIEFPLVYATGGTDMRLGSKDDPMYLHNSEIADEGYFILNGAANKDSVSHVVQYKGADDHSISDPKMKFKVLATGETVERSVSFDSNSIATASIKLSGTTYTIASVSDTSQDDYNISVTSGVETSSSNAYGWENYVIAKGGARIKIAENEIDQGTKSLKVDVSLIDPNNVGDSIIVSAENPHLVSSVDIIAIDNTVDFTNYAGIDLTSPINDVDNAYGYSVNGAYVKLNSPILEETADTLSIDWPESQRLPQVYISTTEAKYYTDYIDLNVETDENAVCSYDLGDGYEMMNQTGGKTHYHPLSWLVFENDYQVFVQCEDEFGNSNTETTNFYLGEDKVPPQITISSPQQDSIVTEEMLSEITVYYTESWKVENSDDLLEFGEPISKVAPVIGGNELTALADNKWIIKETEYNYNQSLSFPVVTNYFNQKSGVVTYVEDDDDITDYFLKFYDNSPIATYYLAFTSPALSEIDSDILTDLQGTTLILFGKEYYVFSAERPSQNSVKMTLMDNFVNDFIGKDETKTFSLSDVGYEITPTFLNEEYVQFKINEETTSMLKVGKMYSLANGITLGVMEIENNKAKFIIGTEKLELQDTNIIDNISSDEAKVNSELIDGAAVKINGTDDNSVLSISSLEVKMTAQDDYFIASGETLLGQPELGEKELLFTKNWDFKYDGFIDGDLEHPQVYVTATINSGTKPALLLELSTDENAVCHYDVYPFPSVEPLTFEQKEQMEFTGGKLHLQNLFDLGSELDYQVAVDCVDTSGNSNTELINFHFSKEEEAGPEEQPPQNQPSNSGGGGGSSSSSSNNDDDEEDETNNNVNTQITNTPKQEKKDSEKPVQLLADAPAEVSDETSFSNKLTAAVIGIREKGGLVYVAGFVLIIASLFGIKLSYSNKKN